MRRTALIIAPLLLLAACSASENEAAPAAGAEAAVANAAGGPSLDGPMLATAGLWRTTTTANGKQAFGALRTCVDAASQAQSDPFAQAAETGCQKPARRALAGGYTYELVCEKDGVKTAVSGEVRGDAKRVVMTSTTRMTGPDGDIMPPATVVIENVHVGPCPADMKPGDFVQEGVGPS